MKLHDLKPAPGAHRERKRIGRGPGSGKGKTGGKGMMGQKARSGPNPSPTFEGGQIRMARKMPRLRGFKNLWRIEYQVINIGQLNDVPEGTELTIEEMAAQGWVHPAKPVKVLGDGELERKLTIHAHKFSAGARASIEAAGGAAVETPWVVERRSRSRGPNPAMRNRGTDEGRKG